MKSKRTTSTSEIQHEVTEITGIDMKDSTRAVEVETNKQNTPTHRIEQTMLVKSFVQVDITAVKKDNQARLPARCSGVRRTTALCPTFVR